MATSVIRNPHILYTRFEITADILGTSFSTSSRSIGDTNQLWGIPANSIIGVFIHNLSLTPNAVLSGGTYNQNLYVAASQQCTAAYNAHPIITIMYIK